jgi:hypothetical protein
LGIVIQGPRVLKQGVSRASLKIKVMHYPQGASDAASGTTLAEIDPSADPERVLSDGKSLYLLIDSNLADIVQGKKLRAIYHPPDSKPIVGIAKGMSTPGGARVEIFKDGVLANPVKKKKSAYEKLK